MPQPAAVGVADIMGDCMTKTLFSLLIAVSVVAMPLALVPSAAEAKTAKQMKDEHKGKVAKQKSAEKSAAKKAAKKSK